MNNNFGVSRVGGSFGYSYARAGHSSYHSEAPPVTNPTCVQTSAILIDFASMMAAAIEATLKPMKERMGATIMPLQRTLETLQWNSSLCDQKRKTI